jgi:hypothetical protein
LAQRECLIKKTILLKEQDAQRYKHIVKRQLGHENILAIDVLSTVSHGDSIYLSFQVWACPYHFGNNLPDCGHKNVMFSVFSAYLSSRKGYYVRRNTAILEGAINRPIDFALHIDDLKDGFIVLFDDYAPLFFEMSY